MAGFYIGHRKRQRLVAALAVMEYGFDKGQIRLDMGGEHGDVVRLPFGVGGQVLQELVFEHLQLAQGAVGGGKLDAVVKRQGRAAFRQP